MIDVNYKNIAYEVNNRLCTAAGETAMEIEQYPDYAEDYSEHTQSVVKKLVGSRDRDVVGTIGDTIYNEDGFWDMARDWIGDELSDAGVSWDDHDRQKHYNNVCDALAQVAPFKSALIMSWKS